MHGFIQHLKKKNPINAAYNINTLKKKSNLNM